MDESEKTTIDPLPPGDGSKKRQPYPSDLSDDVWLLAQTIFPEHTGLPGVSEVKYSVREILNAVFYKLKTVGVTHPPRNTV